MSTVQPASCSRWLPRSTVATIVEQDQRFLMVEEHTRDGIKFNQPAGHIEANEPIASAAIRETLEETRWHVELTHLVGFYVYHASNGATYHRHCFAAKALREEATLALDDGIIAAHWLSFDEIQALANLRTPLVLDVIRDYLSGRHYPLDYIVEDKYHRL